MIINPNAELELKSPKADLHLEVQNIAIEMTKPQVRHRQTDRLDTDRQTGETRTDRGGRQNETCETFSAVVADFLFNEHLVVVLSHVFIINPVRAVYRRGVCGHVG